MRLHQKIEYKFGDIILREILVKEMIKYGL